MKKPQIRIDVTALIRETVDELDNANLAVAVIMLLAINPAAFPGGTK